MLVIKQSIFTGGVWILFGAMFSVVGQDASSEKTTARLAELEAAFQEVYSKEVGATIEKQLESLNANYTRALERAQELVSSEGKLDEAVAIRDEIKRIAANEPTPENNEEASERLTTLRATYQTQLTKINETRVREAAPIIEKFDAALAAFQEQLTKANELDAALAVKAYRQAGLAEKLSGISESPKPEAPENEGDKPMPKQIADVDREKALEEILDWVWSAKYGIGISEDGKRVEAKRVGDEMPEEFELIRIFADPGRSITEPEPFPWHALAGTPEINALHMIRAGAPIEAAHLEGLTTLSNLEFLLLDNSEFAPGAIDGLPGLPGLKQFSTHFTGKFQGDWIPVLHERCPNLEILFLSFGGTNQVWGEEHFAELKKFQQLQRLELQGGGKLDEAFVSSFQQLPDLETISFIGTKWSADPAAIPGLSKWPKLRSFNTRSKPMLAQLPEILALPNLEEIGLAFSSPSDADLKVVAENASRRIKVLRIGRNGTVTDAGVAHLRSMSQLEELHLGGSSKVSQGAVDDLRKKLRDCEIFF